MHVSRNYKLLMYQALYERFYQTFQDLVWNKLTKVMINRLVTTT